MCSAVQSVQANGVGVWPECKGTRHQWSGHEAMAETRLRDRCLDGCYKNRRQSKALCMSHAGRSQWRRGKGKAGRRRTRGNEKGWGGGGVGTSKQTTYTEQAANGTRQHDSGPRRQILAGERGYVGPRLRLRSHTLTSVNQR